MTREERLAIHGREQAALEAARRERVDERKAAWWQAWGEQQHRPLEVLNAELAGEAALMGAMENGVRAEERTTQYVASAVGARALESQLA